MKRAFNKSEKQILFLLADGKCQLCGEPLGRGWHADHIVPFSKGGLTEVRNGQALCQQCNQNKGNKMIHLYNEDNLRTWQVECHTLIEDAILEGKTQSFLAVAGVGSGKTRMALYQAAKQMLRGRFNTVIVVAPTENIKYSWAMNAQDLHGLNLDYKYNFRHSWKIDFNGIAITYQSLNQLNVEFLHRHIDEKTLIIVDEVHHCGDNRSWGEGLEIIGQNAGFVLLLSGTPNRSDNARIPFCEYLPHPEGDKLWKLKTDYSYLYGKSVEDNYCTPVRFHRRGSTILTEQGQETLRNDVDITPAVYNGMLRVKQDTYDGWVWHTFLDANNKLNEINDARNASHAGLVICNTIQDAVNLHELLTKKYGQDFAVLVTSDEKDASKKIERFKQSTQPWIISVNMVSEGVDIPRIRVILYATNYTTPLFFMQVMGRGVRKDANTQDLENHPDMCHMFIPDLAALNKIAEEVEQEVVHIVQQMEEKAREKRERSNKPSLIDLDYVLSSSSNHNGSISMGEHFNTSNEMQMEKIAKRMGTSVEFLMQVHAEMQKANISSVSNVTAKKHPTQIKEELRNSIHVAVNRMAYTYGFEQKEIHYKANEIIGKRTNEQTIDELEKKLSLINSWLTDLDQYNAAV